MPRLPTISLAAHRKDQERRKKALRDLKSALQEYCETVPRERDLELIEVATIVCAYACELYDARAAGYLELPSIDAEMLFGEAGLLNIGVTLDDVWQNLTTLKVRRPKGWPTPDVGREGDSPELRAVMSRLVFGKYVSFTFFSDHPWFYGEVRDCVARRVLETREVYEHRLALIPSEKRAPLLAPDAGPTSSTAGTGILANIREPQGPASTEVQPARQRLKPGPARDLLTARRVAEIVQRVAGNLPWKPQLDDICDELDDGEIPFPKTWRDRKIRSWSDAATTDRPLAKKAIAHHLKNARS